MFRHGPCQWAPPSQPRSFSLTPAHRGAARCSSDPAALIKLRCAERSHSVIGVEKMNGVWDEHGIYMTFSLGIWICEKDFEGIPSDWGEKITWEQSLWIYPWKQSSKEDKLGFTLENCGLDKTAGLNKSVLRCLNLPFPSGWSIFLARFNRYVWSFNKNNPPFNGQLSMFHNWLVVGFNPSEKWWSESQLGWWLFPI